MLPVGVVVAIATTQYRRPVQVAAGVLLGGLLLFLLRGELEIANERRRARRLIADGSRAIAALVTHVVRQPSPVPPPDPPIPVIALRHALLVATGLVAGIILPGINVWQDGWNGWLTATGYSGAFLWTGVQLLLVAAVLRFVGYATRIVRWLVVSVIVLACARVAIFIGLLPGEHFFGAHLPLVGAVAALVVFLLVFFIWETVRLPSPDPGIAQKILRALGFVLAVGSASAFAIGMVGARHETTNGVHVPGATSTHRITQLVNLKENTRESRLAWTYAPILRLHPDELFPPTSAEEYLRRAHCVALHVGGCTSLSCSSCSVGIPRKASAKPQVVFYARVATPDSDPALEGWTPGKQPLATLIQYWFFYDYDRWEAKTLVGQLVQKHDADWEFVAVGLDVQDEPLFLALSAHCGGQVIQWDKDHPIKALPGQVKDGDHVVIETPDADGKLRRLTGNTTTHPVVAVARGSHGNYADDGGRRPPDWGSCPKVRSDSLGSLVYASNVRDLTADSDDDSYFAQARSIEPVTKTSYPLTVSVPWGTETISLGHRVFAPKQGPKSPPNQNTWLHPIKLFFCDRFWHPYRKAPKANCRPNAVSR